MTRGTIKTLAATFAEDPDMTRITDYDSKLDRAQEQFAMDTGCTFKDASWSHAADDANEDLPSDFMWEDRVSYDGLKLDPISRAELERLNPGSDWTAHTANKPTHYIVDPEEARKSFTLYPIPSTAATLRMRYFARPATSTDDAATPLNSTALLAQFHIGLAAYTAWLALMGEISTPEKVTKKRELLEIYNDQVGKCAPIFKNTSSAGWQIRPIR